MAVQESKKVFDKDGLEGVIETTLPAATDAALSQLGATAGATTTTAATADGTIVRLNNGHRVLVRTEMLTAQQDGSYLLPFSVMGELRKREMKDTGTAHEAEQTIVIPVIEETMEVGRRVVETGRVRITKIVREREETFDEPLMREQVTVERVPVGKLVTAPVPIRTEGDTTIIPLLEEVLVVEKRLMLKEELRITRHRFENQEPQTITLRTEEARVERLEGAAPPAPGGPRDPGGASDGGDTGARGH